MVTGDSQHLQSKIYYAVAQKIRPQEPLLILRFASINQSDW